MTIEELRCQFKISLCAGKINNIQFSRDSFARTLYDNLECAMISPPESRRMSNDKGGRDGGESKEDIDILRKEYRNMQANRNAFAHESDLVSHVPCVRLCHS